MASSRCACSPANGITHIRACAMDRSFRQTTHRRACAMDRSRKLFRLFSRHISGTQSFRENRHVIIHLLVFHNPLVPLIGRLVACSARTRADRQTDRTTTVTLAAHARRGLIISDLATCEMCWVKRGVFWRRLGRYHQQTWQAQPQTRPEREEPVPTAHDHCKGKKTIAIHVLLSY